MRSKFLASISDTDVAFEPEIFNNFSWIKGKPGYGTDDFDIRQSIIKGGEREVGTRPARRPPIADDAACAKLEISGVLGEISDHAEFSKFCRTAIIVY